MTNNKPAVKDIMKEILEGSGWLSYPQFLRLLGKEGVAVEGVAEVRAQDEPVIFWGGMSNEVVEALIELLAEGVVRHGAAPLEVYRLEGIQFNLPVVLGNIDALPSDHSPVMYPSILMHKSFFGEQK